MTDSACTQMRRIMLTAASGNRPFAVSPESITTSVPSSTAFRTSVASARVGRGILSIESSICVAVTTNFPRMLHFAMSIFCTSPTFSMSISMPMSPRATMMPSLSSMISSMLLMPSWFSIFEMILMWRPRSPNVFRIVFTSFASWTKLAATKSTLCGMPNSTRSFLSFSWRTGRSTLTPGRFMFFFSPISMSFSTSVTTWSSPQDFTWRDSDPSAQRMIWPGFTDVGSCLYVMARHVSSPLKS
mmetsp:Transcript_71618/g.202175  ORF Transcript_71618/g.202175 Transcript_71618/m.202175 type:complete len:243 (+) Transcript_71618:16-744(+)